MFYVLCIELLEETSGVEHLLVLHLGSSGLHLIRARRGGGFRPELRSQDRPGLLHGEGEEAYDQNHPVQGKSQGYIWSTKNIDFIYYERY